MGVEQTTLVRALRRISFALFVAAGAALLVMAALMVIDVALRYFVNRPLGWTYSLIESVLMPAAFFLALAYTYRRGAHITIDSAYRRFPPGLRRATARIVRVLILCFAAALLWAAIQATVGYAITGDVPPPGSAELQIPVWMWHALVPCGALVLALEIVVELLADEEPADGHMTPGESDVP